MSKEEGSNTIGQVKSTFGGLKVKLELAKSSSSPSIASGFFTRDPEKKRFQSQQPSPETPSKHEHQSKSTIIIGGKLAANVSDKDNNKQSKEELSRNSSPFKLTIANFDLNAISPSSW